MTATADQTAGTGPDTGTPGRATARTWAGLAVLTLPMLLIAIDSMVLVFALPAITADLRPTGTEQLWTVDVYSLLIAGFLVTMSSLGYRYGRRRVLLVGAVLFTAASVLGAASTAPWTLIAARALLGVAGSMIMPGTLSLIRSMFLDRAQRRTAMAVWSAAGALGAAVGPMLGGALIEMFSWHAAFLMNIPVMVLLLVLAPVLVPESRNPHPGRVDPPSILFSLLGMISVVYGVKTLAEGEHPGVAVLALAVGAALVALFVRRQLRLPVPVVDVRLFRVRAFTGAVVTDLLSVFALVGALFALTQYLQLVLGLSVLVSAAWMLPQAVVSAGAGFLAAALVRRVPIPVVVAAGVLVTASGFALMLGLTPDTPPWQVALALCLVGLGAGMGMTITNDVIMSSVRPAQAGQAAAISETAFELGTAFGTAVLGSVLLAFYRSGLAGAEPAGLPAGVPEQAGETLAAALQAAAELPQHLGARLAEAATGAFTDALATTGGIAAVMLVGVAVFAGVMLRGVSARDTVGAPTD